jgi:DNA-binding beta-propeller fold protein YncE
MHKTSGFLLIALIPSVLLFVSSAQSQVLLGNVTAGQVPIAVAVNPATNKTYVVNECGNDPQCLSPGTVTIIRGESLQTNTVTVGLQPVAVAVNSATDKIYVANSICGGNYPTCASKGSVTVMDGSSLQTSSVTVGFAPYAIAVNPVTNQIYVVNYCGNDASCAPTSPGTVTVIDGSTFSIVATVTVGLGARAGVSIPQMEPFAIGVNSVSNKIYVANSCGTDPTCQSPGTVTVIDGATRNTTTVNVAGFPEALAIDALTNQIYVVNNCGTDPVNCASGGTVTDIDANNNNNTTSISVGNGPNAVAVDAVTNQIYAVNNLDGTVTQIDGFRMQQPITIPLGNSGSSPTAIGIDTATDKIYVATIFPAAVIMIDASGNTYKVALPSGSSPIALAVNSITNLVFTANQAFVPGNASVIAGAEAAALQFYALPPCRLVDTRQDHNPILGGTSQSFMLPELPQGNPCIPAGVTAAAYSLNVTVVPHSSLGYLTIWPTGEDQPLVSTMNSPDGRTKANAAIVPAGYQGEVSVYATDTTDVILDIDGYFALPGTGYQFYPLTPCRVVDTRPNHDPLLAGQERDYTIPGTGNCGVPSTATAYSFNVTVLPGPGGLDYLTVWPKGQQRPVISTLNDPTGTIVANAAIVPAGTESATAFYANSNNTDLLVDVNGYFAAPGQGGLSLYPMAPCRVIDTRAIGDGEPFSGMLTPPVDVVDSVCGPPVSAQAYVFNATVVPLGTLGYLTLWPDTETKPTVSTLNATDGAVTSNMAIVPTLDGSVDAFAAGLTQLILDISGYFAP